MSSSPRPTKRQKVGIPVPKAQPEAQPKAQLITKPKSQTKSSPKAKTKAKPKPKVPAEPDRKILVAVDFGSTFSGVAWTQTRKPEMQTPIVQWPDCNGTDSVSSDKVPSEIAYNGDEYKWGFQIPDSVPRHQWFKLELDPSQLPATGLAKEYPDPLKAPPTYHDAAVQHTTDFMTALRKQAEKVLQRHLGSALSSTPIEYIITVPAVWSDMAQAKTRACAEAAGMGNGTALHIISEPEAAALYALDAMDPHNVKVGDTFVLCDAGGGTVDLVTYTVSALKPILKLNEATPGTGSLCGASFLNRKFQEFMESKFGGQSGWDDEIMEEAMKRFETIVKRKFCGTFEEVFPIPVPGLEDNPKLGIRKNKIIIGGAEVRAMFEPVLEEVVRLVTGQIKASKKNVKAVIMVGGFSENAYLINAITLGVKQYNVEVMQCPNSWTAVVRGALMKALASASPASAKVKISARSARKHYGFEIEKEFIDLEHDDARKYWDPHAGVYRILEVEWFNQKGSVVKEEKPIRLTYYRARLVSEGPFKAITVTILSCSDPDNKGAPKYEDDPDVKELVKVTADLSRIPPKRIPQEMGVDGQMWYIATYQIQITYYSAYTTYELLYGGTNYGRVASEYV